MQRNGVIGMGKGGGERGAACIFARIIARRPRPDGDGRIKHDAVGRIAIHEGGKKHEGLEG